MKRWRGPRTIVQVAGLLALVVLPLAGLLRIDFARGALLLLGREVGLRDFAAVCGLAIIAAAAPLLTYSTIGMAWCGWACPQGTLAEWADRWTHRLLGSRADVRVEGEGLRVAPSRNRVGNWILFVAGLLAASLLLGAIPLFWFLSPADIGNLLSGQADQQFATFMARLYIVFAVAVLVDIAVLRHFWCDYLCLYRYGMLLFRAGDGLHVRHDGTRSSECTKCRACAVACVTRIEPTNIGRFDRCIDCGECIDACTALHERRGNGTSLLSFHDAGLRRPGVSGWMRVLPRRLGIPGILTAAGIALLAWGLRGGA